MHVYEALSEECKVISKKIIISQCFYYFFIIILAIGLESCPEPQIPNYGIRQGDRFMVGDVVQFSCEQGYSLQVKMNVYLCISPC